MLDPPREFIVRKADAFLNPFAGQPAQPWDLEDRDSCPKAPTNDTRVMAVGCPRKREKAVPGKTFRM